jgi:hypothetical protein
MCDVRRTCCVCCVCGMPVLCHEFHVILSTFYAVEKGN